MGIVEIERNDAWLNGYNPMLAIMTRANHDVCQERDYRLLWSIIIGSIDFAR
jgi:hypothetical protein